MRIPGRGWWAPRGEQWTRQRNQSAQAPKSELTARIDRLNLQQKVRLLTGVDLWALNPSPPSGQYLHGNARGLGFTVGFVRQHVDRWLDVLTAALPNCGMCVSPRRASVSTVMHLCARRTLHVQPPFTLKPAVSLALEARSNWEPDPVARTPDLWR
jgi:hypothetical protein